MAQADDDKAARIRTLLKQLAEEGATIKDSSDQGSDITTNVMTTDSVKPQEFTAWVSWNKSF